MNKKAVIVVSFGTTFAEQRRKSLGGIEEALRGHYSDRDCFVAYTSGMIRRIYAKRYNMVIASVAEQLKQCLDEAYQDILVVVTHMMWGHEYEKVIHEIGTVCEAYEGDGNTPPMVRVSRPLSTTAEDRKVLAEGMIEDYQAIEHDYDGILCMGHGSSHENSIIYEEIHGYLQDVSTKYWLRTVEGELTLNPSEIVASSDRKTEKGNYLLVPFMIVAGDHATNDLAGDDEESWKSQLEFLGCTVTTNLVGLGERPWIRNRLIELSKNATDINQLRSLNR